jgi:hypothetical protein
MSDRTEKNALDSIDKKDQERAFDLAAQFVKISSLSQDEMNALMQDYVSFTTAMTDKYGQELCTQMQARATYQAATNQSNTTEEKFQEFYSTFLPANGQKHSHDVIPIFHPPRDVEIKKDISLQFGSVDRIEKDYPALLPKRLASGKTLKEHLDEVRYWFDNLHGEDLGNWVKLFSFVKAVKTEAQEGKEVNLKIIGQNRYVFEVKPNKDFYSFFLLPDKKSGYITTRAKQKLLKWLYNNQKTITFPMISNNSVWAYPLQIFAFAEEMSLDEGQKRFIFMIDTNVIDSRFDNYISIQVHEVDLIQELWESIAKEDPDFEKYELSNFEDLPLKFLFTLKQIYNPAGDFNNGNYTGNLQRLSSTNLDSHLGKLAERIKRHIKKRRITVAANLDPKVKELKGILLETIFKIATSRRWLMSMPQAPVDNIYTFNLNNGYFA